MIAHSINFLNFFQNLSSHQKQNNLIINIQYLTAIFTVNYNLRKKCLFKLFELYYYHDTKFTNEKLMTVLNICCSLINRNVADLIEDNFEYLLQNWISRDYEMFKYPWFLTSESQSNFFIDYRDRIALGIMRHDWSVLPAFCQTMQVNMNELLMPILPNCIALLLPHIAEIPSMSESYTRESTILQHNLYEVFTEERVLKTLSDSTMDVIAALVMELDDERLFLVMFDFELKSCHDSHDISYKVFEECLRFIQVSLKK